MDTCVRMLLVPAPVRLLARWQLPVQVISAACAVDDSIFQRHPEILFELERQACATHAEQQDFVAAVQHCRQRLTPLASEHPQFMPALKVSHCNGRVVRHVVVVLTVAEIMSSASIMPACTPHAFLFH